MAFVKKGMRLFAKRAIKRARVFRRKRIFSNRRRPVLRLRGGGRQTFRARPHRRLMGRRRRFFRLPRNRNPQNTLPNTKIVRFKNVTSLTLTLVLDSTTTTWSPVNVNADDRWLPAAGSDPLGEAMFNSYEKRKLIGVSFKYGNWKNYLSDEIWQTSGSSPPLQHSLINASATEPTNRKIWYYRDPVGRGHPDKGDEAAFSSMLMSRSSHIWGKLPHMEPAVLANVVPTISTYEATFSASGTVMRNYTRIRGYPKHRGNIDSSLATDFYSNRLWMMPDQFFPASYYTLPTVPGGTYHKTTDIFTCDCEVWSTWALSKQVQNWSEVDSAPRCLSSTPKSVKRTILQQDKSIPGGSQGGREPPPASTPYDQEYVRVASNLSEDFQECTMI